MEQWKLPVGDWIREDSDRFAAAWAAMRSGGMNPEDFRKFRVQNGIYGIRGEADRFMMRIKIPFGVLSADQLATLAAVARNHAPGRQAHVTTRQNVQFHHLSGEAVPAILEDLARVGLTTRESGGNTVRNVTCCPYAGISATECFDVRPYARAVVDHFFRNPLCQNLPRKMKFAFEGCSEDHARIPIHDIGAVATLQNGHRGFVLYVGGGLGAVRMSGALLEPFTPVEDLILTFDAIVRVFDRHGNRSDRNKARLKFLVREWGIDRFREAVERERRALRAVWSGSPAPAVRDDGQAPAAQPEPPLPPPAASPGETRWRESNVVAQRQTGWFRVTVRCPLGDIDADGMDAVADLSRRYGSGEIRTAVTQNLLLPWVPAASLPEVYRQLAAAGLAADGADQGIDITRCPGADTCNLAITHSRGLAEALTGLMNTGLGDRPEVRPLQFKISGCPNSCGQHAIADIGLSGASRRIGQREAPHYLLQVGGYTLPGQAVFAQPLLQIPARRVPEAVVALLDFYRQSRQQDERFTAFVDRIGTRRLREVVAPCQGIADEDSSLWFEDLGAAGVPFAAQVGEGECAS